MRYNRNRALQLLARHERIQAIRADTNYSATPAATASYDG